MADYAFGSNPPYELQSRRRSRCRALLVAYWTGVPEGGAATGFQVA